mmetsp:Transcript_31279/g.75617  ORF Transcript_31279/g.75617 Transcript_31279/m.75617 type:complete len:276 (+) Transcript_31279:656-1483(+)|eukprot:CAMPEP_0181110766 /NCGR_PEP_ID=MMETSP1071-20121207/18895_1 /TAXON_ID=35127 /ORGANISM="Thalassiosira sp., Strain NH16" /LENGTH=275 /DNA_ID=CAMNT_0023194571 /DNA_START=616 /DNA_END=1443 /DNA_ORIENTATION=+
MKATGSGALYYSSLPNHETFKTEKGQSTPPRRKDVLQSSPSPRKTIENASSSISNVVATSISSAKKLKNRARSFVPKKLLSAQCTPMVSNREGGGDLDAFTPVIYYQDEDAVVKPAKQGNTSFIDPFSFVDSDSPNDKKDADDYNSPTSVIPVRLFQEENSANNGTSAIAKESDKRENASFWKGEVVSFDCPMFTHDFKFNEEDTSIDVGSTIKSINAMSIKEEIKSFRESIRAKREACEESLELWQDPILSWDGFTRSESFTKCDWESHSDDTA